MCVTAIAIGGLILAGAGAGVAAYGSHQQAEAAQDAEKARKKQMNLDAMRRKREAIREAIQARSLALSTTTAQGAGGAGSSALGGAYGQSSGTLAGTTQATNQNVQLGNTIFNANMQAAKADSIVSFGQGMQSVGQAMMANNENLAKIFGKPA